MLTLYHAALSPCAQKVRLSLHEKKLTYESVMMNLILKENLKPNYLQINPNGVVPTLVENEKPVIESTVICEYLDDRFAETSLRPADPVALAHMRLWTKRVDDHIHPASGVLLFSAFLRRAFQHQTAEQRVEMLAKIPDQARRLRQEDLLAHGLDSPLVPGAVLVFKKMIKDVQSQLSAAPWIVGDEISLADFALAPYVLVLENFGLTRIFQENPNMAAWFDRLKATDGYRGGIVAYQTPQQTAMRAGVLPEVTPRMDALFA